MYINCLTNLYNSVRSVTSFPSFFCFFFFFWGLAIVRVFCFGVCNSFFFLFQTAQTQFLELFVKVQNADAAFEQVKSYFVSDIQKWEEFFSIFDRFLSQYHHVCRDLVRKREAATREDEAKVRKTEKEAKKAEKMALKEKERQAREERERTAPPTVHGGQEEENEQSKDTYMNLKKQAGGNVKLVYKNNKMHHISAVIAESRKARKEVEENLASTSPTHATRVTYDKNGLPITPQKLPNSPTKSAVSPARRVGGHSGVVRIHSRSAQPLHGNGHRAHATTAGRRGGRQGRDGKVSDVSDDSGGSSDAEEFEGVSRSQLAGDLVVVGKAQSPVANDQVKNLF